MLSQRVATRGNLQVTIRLRRRYSPAGSAPNQSLSRMRDTTSAGDFGSWFETLSTVLAAETLRAKSKSLRKRHPQVDDLWPWAKVPGRSRIRMRERPPLTLPTVCLPAMPAARLLLSLDARERRRRSTSREVAFGCASSVSGAKEARLIAAQSGDSDHGGIVPAGAHGRHRHANAHLAEGALVRGT